MWRHVIAGLVIFFVAVGVLSATVRIISPVAAFDEPTLLDVFPKASLATTPVAAGGGYVVWLSQTGRLDEHGYTESLIKAARLPDRQPIEVASVGVTDWWFMPLDTDGEVVVWVDERAPDLIRARRLTGGEPFTVWELPKDAGTASVSGLAVADGWVVWSSYDSTVARVQARNVAAMSDIITVSEAPLDSEGGAQLGGVDTDDGWVVWGEGWVNVTWDEVVAQRLGTDDPPRRFDNADDVDTGDYKLAGDVLALAGNTQRLPDTAVQTVTLIDLETLAERTVSIDYTEHVDGGSYPYVAGLMDFDERYLYVAFQLSIPTSSPGLRQVVAYDLDTDSIFPVLRDFPRLAGAEGGVMFWEVGGASASIHAARIEDRLPSAFMPQESTPDPNDAYFVETGHYLRLGFKAYWERNGGLPIFGYPLTEEYRERNRDTTDWYTVQFTERQRFEWHPENAGTPYEVLLGRLGAEQAADLGLLDDEPFRYRGDDEGPDAGCIYFRETGHYACDAFVFYWREHGLEMGDPGVSYRESLALFGYPLSEPFVTTNSDGDTVWTQYFERAVFELHPENVYPYRLLLRRLGAEQLAERGW